jgi:hypothetical protein
MFDDLSFDQLEDRIEECDYALWEDPHNAPLLEEVAQLRQERYRRYDTWPMATLLRVRDTATNWYLRASFFGALVDHRIRPAFTLEQPREKFINDLETLIANFPPNRFTLYERTLAEYEERLKELTAPERHVAMMMGSQRRLGSDSALGRLDPDLLHYLIAKQ